MEYRQLGASGIRIPVLSFGTATFGGSGNFFKAWGSTQVNEAARLVDICLDAGVNLFDTANTYSKGLSEEILGKAIKGKRDKLLISTKCTFQMSEEVNDYGSSRLNILHSCEQ
ncbi:MAG TPA: aldo/keto reductase, partial [Chryseolinea sp.]|nr:aldo/keto reductase [Chryseolinea sp.]